MVGKYGPGPTKVVKYSSNYDDLFKMLERDKGISMKEVIEADVQQEHIDRMKILKTLTMPEEALDNGIAVRYKDEFQSAASASIGMRQPFKCDWQAQPTVNSGSNQQQQPSDMFIATFNDSPWCLMVFYDPNPTYKTWSYQWTMNGTQTLFVNGANSSVQHNRASPNNAYQPHGSWLYSDKDLNDVRYVWVDGTIGASVPTSGGGSTAAKSTIVLTFTTAPTIDGGTLSLMRYNNGAPEEVVAARQLVTVAGGATYTFQVTTSDYYAIQVTGINAVYVDAGMSILSQGVTSVLCHIAAKNIQAHASQLSKCGRVLALSCRVTDVSAYQYLQGEVAVANCLDGNAWYPLFGQGLAGSTSSSFNAVANYTKAILGPLPEGAYTYHKPSKREDFSWQEWVELDPVNGNVLDQWYNLDSNTPVKVICMTTNNLGDNSGQTGNGAQCYITLCYFFEWQTTDDWTPTQNPTESSLAWRNALEELILFPDATGNAWHWRDLLGGIAKVVNWTAPLWRAAATAGGAALNAYIPGAGAAVPAAVELGLQMADNYVNKGKRKA